MAEKPERKGERLGTGWASQRDQVYLASSPVSGKEGSTLGAPGPRWQGSEPRDLGRWTWAEAAELGRKSLTCSLTQMLVLPVGEARG